jgi:2-methylcitrate dehydratase PrpD
LVLYWANSFTHVAELQKHHQVADVEYADLPPSAVESARRDILDTFGWMLGGSGSPGIDALFAVISRWGGLAESRVLLRGIRLPAPQAALLNASMGLR